ncbi:winged helix family two component transcriptional regulator [Sinimarinibacterium flocculans]|uniref:Phosphate regulon transcriptional regulatory protein PhoB n=2 Tax=Sinimarinibacterium flocculans TaxID=985250 RepID=A0A318EEB8_9GAMM|nr:winged helix family two component transcriptional regulator [Sinimarinibacterium flocculans]
MLGLFSNEIMLMQGKLILVVEDEAPIRELLRFALARAEFRVVEAESAQDARLRIADQRPDLILMDWMMPGVSGIELTRELKSQATTRDIPVIMVTARAEEEDAIRGLNVGCDDYVSKPFSYPELIARINAVLRRAVPGGEEERVAVNGLVVDAASQRVTAKGEPVKLGPTEYRLLHFFVSHPERVYSREQVLDRVWGQNVYVEERTVDVHIRRLRKALEPFGYDAMIQTVRGSGYRFSEKY